MSTTEHRLAANRANAQLSTGPNTAAGRVRASRNATRHGLLSARLFLDDEDPAAFDAMAAELAASLNPVGAIEVALVERIAVTMWRQRRLVQAETATIALARTAKKIANGVASEIGYGAAVPVGNLEPFDADQEQWCRAALAEIEVLTAVDMASIKATAPHVWHQLNDDADGHDNVEAFLAVSKGGLEGFLSELTLWCHERLREAAARPQMLALADQVRAKRLVLSADTLDVFARYQTTLDNQLFKALRVFRETQDWRLRTLGPATPAGPQGEDEVTVDEAA